jgi:hypothetical protein
MSAGIVYALPAPPLPPEVPLFVKTAVTWTGWDGSVWDLTAPDSGVVLVNEGVEGLHLPTFRAWTRQSPAVPGQTFAGAIAEPRDVVLPLLVFEDGTSQEWLDRDRAFWRSMHPARYGTLTVSPAGTGTSRSLRLRLVPEDHAFSMDPVFACWAAYVVRLVADRPFWEGQPVRAAWTSPTSQEFYETTGPHLVNINSGHVAADAEVTNAGDEDAWPVWTVIGPVTAAHMGVGDLVLDAPAVEAGKALVIDTDPRVQTVIEYDYDAGDGTEPEAFTDPVDRTADLAGAVDFAAIPAGGTSPINISITGGGLLRVELTPLYWRAW